MQKAVGTEAHEPATDRGPGHAAPAGLVHQTFVKGSAFMHGGLSKQDPHDLNGRHGIHDGSPFPRVESLKFVDTNFKNNNLK
jgi:hypothetical protein